MRRPKNKAKKKPDERQLKLPYTDLQPGWKGWKWLLCSDNKWHLVTAIYDEYVANTLCADDLKVAEQVNPNDHPMCNTCCEVQAARWGKSPSAH